MDNIALSTVSLPHLPPPPPQTIGDGEQKMLPSREPRLGNADRRQTIYNWTMLTLMVVLGGAYTNTTKWSQHGSLFYYNLAYFYCILESLRLLACAILYTVLYTQTSAVFTNSSDNNHSIGGSVNSLSTIKQHVGMVLQQLLPILWVERRFMISAIVDTISNYGTFIILVFMSASNSNIWQSLRLPVVVLLTWRMTGQRPTQIEAVSLIFNGAAVVVWQLDSFGSSDTSDGYGWQFMLVLLVIITKSLSTVLHQTFMQHEASRFAPHTKGFRTLYYSIITSVFLLCVNLLMYCIITFIQFSSSNSPPSPPFSATHNDTNANITTIKIITSRQQMPLTGTLDEWAWVTIVFFIIYMISVMYVSQYLGAVTRQVASSFISVMTVCIECSKYTDQCHISKLKIVSLIILILSSYLYAHVRGKHVIAT